MKTETLVGELAEQMAWELHRPYKSTSYTSESRALDPEYGYRMTGEFEEPALPCPHARWVGEAVLLKRLDGSAYANEREYEVPKAALCLNECGHNITVLCLGCLDDARAVTEE